MKSPHQKATIDATTIRPVLPKMTSRAGWITALKGSSGSAGRWITKSPMTVAKIIAIKPAQITLRVRA